MSSKSENPTDATAPILCGLEIIAGEPGQVPAPVRAELVRGAGAKKSFVLFSEIEKWTDERKEDMKKLRQVR